MKKLAHMLLVLLAGLPLFAQQQQQPEDSLVWLMSAKSAKMVDVEGVAASSFIPWASIWVPPLSQGIQGKMGRREEKLPLFSFCLSLVAKR